jgi:MOSC domain-containing protein YiiM
MRVICGSTPRRSMAKMSTNGFIYQINVSRGGVPKRPVWVGRVTAIGLEGDAQRDRRHHGGPERALCLLALETVAALQAEGHPIFPGAIGENLTIAGLDWRRVLPGSTLALGEHVRIAVTDYAVPCRNIAPAFIDGNIQHVSARLAPHFARVYARVLQPGTLYVGDRALLLPT